MVTIRNKDKPEDITPSSDTVSLPETGSYRLSSEQAGQTLRWTARPHQSLQRCSYQKDIQASSGHSVEYRR